MRAVIPSIMAAVPKTIPDSMQSLVLEPTTFSGACRRMRGRREAFVIRESRELEMPGIMAPPRNAPVLSTTDTLEAVPRSPDQAGALHIFYRRHRADEEIRAEVWRDYR